MHDLQISWLHCNAYVVKKQKKKRRFHTTIETVGFPASGHKMGEFLAKLHLYL